MMFLLVGLQRIPTEGRSISTGMALPDGSTANGTFSQGFLMLGRHRLDLIVPDLLPLSVVFLIVIALAVWVFLELTRHGRLMYAIGSNAQAASLAGTNVNRYKIAAYMISGADRVRGAGRLQAQCLRHRHRCAVRRDPAAGADDDERALLHPGFHQGRGPGDRACLYLRALR
jgi:simple sugar transport system permease protein